MDTDKPNIRMRHMGYSKFWLEHTGYFENAGNEGPGVILFAPNSPHTPEYSLPSSSTDSVNGGDHWFYSVMIFTAIISSMMTLFVSYYFTHYYRPQHKLQYEYTPIISKI